VFSKLKISEGSICIICPLESYLIGFEQLNLMKDVFWMPMLITIWFYVTETKDVHRSDMQFFYSNMTKFSAFLSLSLSLSLQNKKERKPFLSFWYHDKGLGGKYFCVLFQVMPCMHWRLHWMLHLVSSAIGTKIKLTLALGPMFSVTLITMLLVCKILFNVPFPFLVHVMLGEWWCCCQQIRVFVIRARKCFFFYSCVLVPFVLVYAYTYCLFAEHCHQWDLLEPCPQK
jgi:hypothetical protein